MLLLRDYVNCHFDVCDCHERGGTCGRELLHDIKISRARVWWRCRDVVLHRDNVSSRHVHSRCGRNRTDVHGTVAVNIRRLHQGPIGDVQQLSRVRHGSALCNGADRLSGCQIRQQVRNRGAGLCHLLHHRGLRRYLQQHRWQR
uniref:(northern house mosquito) hypothetical protein n=1 Tax=Culex pipiens TaxID=7175 RepID=A0A8D8BGZ7_CULPI